jgi:DNA-binding SARP family transcriptional activator
LAHPDRSGGAVPEARLAKLARPRTEGLLRRERLFARLDEARAQPMVWIAAPPGAGKTSLVSSWIDARGLPCLWYRVDAGDTDAATFFHYLGVAVAAHRHAGAKPLPMLTLDLAQDLGAFTRRWFRELFAQVPEAFVMVFDNYHELPERSVLHDIVAEAVAQAPLGVQAIAISRFEPSPRFARLRAARGLALLDCRELQLTREETTALAAVLGMAPSVDLESVHEQAAGWAAGLVLLAESLRRAPAAASVASNAHLDAIFDYFATLLFDEASEVNRQRLLRLSFLKQITRTGAIAVTGDLDVTELLDWLVRRHLFTERHVAGDDTFVFHALFRAFLQQRGRATMDPSEITRLQRESAAILESEGDPEAAFDLLLATGTQHEAARVVRTGAATLVQQERRQTLRHWLHRLPFALVDADPWLLHWLGIANLGSDPEAARRHLKAAMDRFEAAGMCEGVLLSAAALLDLIVSGSGSNHGVDDIARRLRATLRGELGPVDGVSTAFGRGAVALANALFFRGVHEPAEPWLLQVLERMVADRRDPDLAVAAASVLMQLQWIRGEVEANQRLLVEIADLGNSTAVTPKQRVWWAWWCCQHLLHRLDFEATRAMMSAIERLSDDTALIPTRSEFGRLAALTHRIGSDDHNLARHVLETDVLPHVAEMRPEASAFVHMAFAGTLADLGNARLALRHLDQAQELCDRFDLPFARFFLGMHRILGEVDVGEHEQALARSGALLEELSPRASPLLRCSVLLLQAWAALAAGDDRLVESALREGLAISARKNLLVPLPTSRRFLTLLIAEALRRGIEPAQAQHIARKRGLTPPLPAPDAWPWPVRIRLLGSFEVIVDGQSITSSHKAPYRLLELLQAIAAGYPEGIPVRDLIDTFWSDSDGDVARNTFQVTIHRLRRLLGNDASVVARSGRISLDPAICWIDARAFEAQASQACLLPGPDDTQLADACARYRGHVSATDRDPAWLPAMRERVRHTWLDLVRLLGERLEARADWSAATRLYLRAVEIDPAAEELYRRAMRCQASAGEPHEALRTFARCREQLATCLRAEPSPEMERLRAAIGAGLAPAGGGPGGVVVPLRTVR